MIRRTWLISLIFVFSGALIFGCGSNQQTDQSKSTKSDEVQVAATHVKKVSLDVKGMTCTGCQYNIENSLKKVDGVIQAKADYTKAKAEVEYDPETTNVDKLVAAVNDLGYETRAPQMNE